MEVVFLTFILVLSIFLGFELISKVPATLHTPLMSGANAISGITLAGAFLAAGSVHEEMATWAGCGSRDLCINQCGWRLSGNGSHAQHVQEQDGR